MASVKVYRFRHRSAIFRESSNTKDYKSNNTSVQALIDLAGSIKILQF